MTDPYRYRDYARGQVPRENPSDRRLRPLTHKDRVLIREDEPGTYLALYESANQNPQEIYGPLATVAAWAHSMASDVRLYRPEVGDFVPLDAEVDD